MALSLKKLGKKIFDQVNPFDQGKTFSNPQGVPDVLRGTRTEQQIQQGRVNVRVPTSLANTGNLRAGQVVPANFSRLRTPGLAGNVLRASPVGGAVEGLRDFSNFVSAGINAPRISNLDVPEEVKANLRLRELSKAGITPTTSTRGVVQRGVGLGIQTAGTALSGSVPRAFVPKTVPQTALRFGAAGAGYGAGTAATNPNAKFGDIAKGAATGAVLGAGIPTLTGGAKALTRSKVTVQPIKTGQSSIASTGIEPVVPKVTTKQPAVPQVRSAEESILFGNQPKVQQKQLSVPQTLSPDRIIREKVTRPVERAVNKVIFKAQTSRNPVLRTAGRVAQGISREAGVSPELLQQKRLMRGGVETGKLVRSRINELGADLNPDSKTRVWATIDTEQAAKSGMTVDPGTLTPQEQVYRQKLTGLQKEITEGNLSRGFIEEGQAANPNYLKRGYSLFEENSDASKAYDQTRKNLLVQFKGRKDVSDKLIDDAITDPGYLVGKKAAESHAAWAISDYGTYVNKNGLASDFVKPGYAQLPDSKIYGDAAGKWVPKGIAEDFTGFQYNMGIMNAWNDLITAYDRLGLRQAKKQLLTVFNPAVRAGNQFSNRVVFANMGGINPLQFNKEYASVGKLIKNNDPLYREAVSQGLTGIDITQADFAKNLAKYSDDPNIARQAAGWVRKSYSRADDKARIAAYVIHRNRGLTPEQAAFETQRAFQDYNSVGFFYDLMAKTPVIGNAFVRFAGDALRIAKNAAVDHPLRNIGTVALWANLVNLASKLSGESPEDKATREGRFGAPQIPFTDISMTVQTPFGEVNVARFLPFYQLNEIQNSLARVSPIQSSPTQPQGWQDPLLGQVAQLIADKDFRGKSISDPENTVDAEGNRKFADQLPVREKAQNVTRFLGTQNLPLGKEIDSLVSAALGKEDIYGKKRSLPQAIGRAAGVKIEQFGPEQAQKSRETEAYFDEKAEVDKEIQGLPTAAQEAFRRLTGVLKSREKVANEFELGTTRYKKAPVYNFPEDKWKDLTSHPDLYDKMQAFKERENQRDSKPIQPEFDKRLSREFRTQLINNKSQAPGEDVEADARMYSDPEWDKYQQIRDEYNNAAKKYYPERKGEFVDELVKHQQSKFPEKGTAKKAYDEAFAKYAKGQGPKPGYTDAVDSDKQAYEKAKWQWTNTERKARGLPTIAWETWDNVSFGFQDDEERIFKELKYAKGYGGGFGSKPKTLNSPYEYAISSTSKVSVKQPKSSKPFKVSAKKTSVRQPKVSLKKSKV